MIFSLIFFRTYSKQRWPPPPIGVRVWVNGPFLLRESEKMREMREISFLRAGLREKPFIVIVVAWKRKKSVHDCAKLEKNDKFAWFACAWIKRSLLAWFDTPLPGGPQRPFRPITYTVFYVCGLCFIKSCFLLEKVSRKTCSVPNFQGWKKRRRFGIFGLYIHFFVFKILQSKCSVGSTAILQQSHSLQRKTGLTG